VIQDPFLRDLAREMNLTSAKLARVRSIRCPKPRASPGMLPGPLVRCRSLPRSHPMSTMPDSGP
jgi:hypothetical protein